MSKTKSNTEPTMGILADSRDSDIWQILPGETPEHFQAFREFRDMAYPQGYSGPWKKRTLTGARRIVAEKFHRHWDGNAFYQMAEYFRWHDRARAFDLELDSVASEKLMSEAATYRRAHLRRMAKLAELGEAEIDRHIRRSEALNRNPSDVIPITRPTETLEILERVTKTERLVLGESTENVGGASPIRVDLSGLTDSELADLERIRKKIDGT